MGQHISFQRRAAQAAGAWSGWVARRARLVLALSLVGCGLLASQIPKMRADFSTEGLLRADDPAVEAYDDFRSRFGRDESILVAIAATDVFAARTLEQLRALHEALESEVPDYDEITSLVNARWTRGEAETLIVEELMERWPTTAAAREALRQRALENPAYLNTLVSRDARLTAIVIRPNVYSSLESEADADWSGFDDRPDAAAEYLTSAELDEMVRATRRVIERFEGDDFRIHLVGAPVQGEHMTRISTADTGLYTSLSFVFLAILLYALFRRTSAVVLSTAVVAAAILSTLGAMAWLGLPFSSPTQILPNLLVAVGTCDSVHVLAIFYQRLGSGDTREEAVAQAFSHSGPAIVMTSVTTAAGLASFMGAGLRPVSDLGSIAAIGILLALAFTFTLLPAALVLWPSRARAASGSSPRLQQAMERVGATAMRHPLPVLAATMLLVALAALGMADLRFGLDTLSWVPPDDPMRVATELIDEKFEGINTVEIVIDSGEEAGLYDPDRAARIEAATRRALTLEVDSIRAGHALSLIEILKETHRALNENDPAYYVVPRRRDTIAQELLLFEGSGSDDLERLTTTDFREARLSLQVPIVDGMRYPAYLDRLASELDRILGEASTARITGSTYLTARAFEETMSTLVRSYGMALALITPLMMLMLGSLRRGLLAMVPNLFPIVVVLGFMGWAGIPLNLPTLLVGSIIIGLAVDDTIHFMSGFARFRESGDDAESAVQRTLATTGNALLATSVILCGSFLIFLAGYMRVLNDFGRIAALGAAAAFLADIVLAPALLALFPGRAATSSGAVSKRSARLERAT